LVENMRAVLCHNSFWSVTSVIDFPATPPMPMITVFPMRLLSTLYSRSRPIPMFSVGRKYWLTMYISVFPSLICTHTQCVVHSAATSSAVIFLLLAAAFCHVSVTLTFIAATDCYTVLSEGRARLCESMGAGSLLNGYVGG
jgi:hypothetical protein